MNLKIFRIRETAKLPTRANPADAGLDLYYCPNGEKKRFPDDIGLTIVPRESVLIPTGIKAEIPFGYMLEIKNKSSIAHKRQLIVGACVVDSGYDGEIYVNIHNIGLENQTITPGEKVAQAILIPIVHCRIEEVKDSQFINFNSERGDNGFGSSGRFWL